MIDKARQYLRNGHKRILLQLPCGGGKSVIMGMIAKSATDKNKRVLVIVHRLELCEQLRQTFRACGVDMCFCYIDMVQSVTKKPDDFFRHFDLLMIDECHHHTGKTKTYSRITSMFEYIIGVSATPITPTGNGLGDQFDVLIQGPQVRWLIDNGFLADYQLYRGETVELGKLNKVRGEYDQKQQSLLLEHPEVYADCVRNYKFKADGTKAIVYCVSVAAAEGTAEAFREAGYKAQAISGDKKLYPDKRRKAIMDAFRCGEIQILTNALLFDEGYDCPDCDCVILWKKTASTRLFIQAVSRCMRKDPNNPNKIAKILDAFSNYRDHDLPCSDREWTLEPPPKGKKKDAPVKLCEQCECVCYASQRICPSCGYVFPQADKLIPLIHLEALDDQILRKKRTWRDFKTWDEVEYARKRLKYRPAWSFYQCEENSIAIPENQKRRWQHIKTHSQNTQNAQDAQNII